MQNIYENIKAGLQFNKFILDKLMFVEYTCPIPDEESGIWSQTDYIVHVLSGEKIWRTLDGTVKVKAGDTAYIKKGASFIRQFFDDDFCMLGFFITDDFIKETMGELKERLHQSGNNDIGNHLLYIKETPLLKSYFQSMLHYFAGKNEPVNTLLELKFKELLISIVTDPENYSLRKYFINLANGALSLPAIMERNFNFNLSLDEFARLCHRSLSSFKRDFQKYYSMTPGKWLLSKRLDRAALLLNDASNNISGVAYECGFESISHFSRVFKEKFKASPQAYRNNVLAA
jgi:AraC-like DNA-binding protein